MKIPATVQPAPNTSTTTSSSFPLYQQAQSSDYKKPGSIQNLSSNDITLKTHEILVILALKPNGALIGDAVFGGDVNIGTAIRAAILLSLISMGRLRFNEKTKLIDIVSTKSTKDVILDEAIAKMSKATKKHSMAEAIQFLHGIMNCRKKILSQLVRKGILHHINVDQYAVTDARVKQDIIDKIRYVCLTPKEQLKVYSEEDVAAPSEASSSASASSSSAEDALSATPGEEPSAPLEESEQNFSPSEERPLSPMFYSSSASAEEGQEKQYPTATATPEEDDEDEDFEVITHAEVEVEQPVKFLSQSDYTLLLTLIPLLIMSKNSIFMKLFFAQEVPSATKKANELIRQSGLNNSNQAAHLQAFEKQATDTDALQTVEAVGLTLQVIAGGLELLMLIASIAGR